MADNLVSLSWLAERMGDPELVVADCRFQLGQPDAGREAYERGHISGAVYVDLERHMSGPVREHGGRHPLPDLGTFSLWLGQQGIGNDSLVVAYDDQGGAMASRLWWMLRFLGHQRVHLLSEGFGAWKAAGYPVDSEEPLLALKRFTPHVHPAMMISVHDLHSRLGQPGVTIVDAREPGRYRGEFEPIDAKAGHIPGAVNRFWKDALDADGRWRPSSEQAARFADLNKDDELVVYCGSGVTACPNVLALQEAGFERVRLYLGSWSDWISYSENPIATGDE